MVTVTGSMSWSNFGMHMTPAFCMPVKFDGSTYYGYCVNFYVS